MIPPSASIQALVAELGIPAHLPFARGLSECAEPSALELVERQDGGREFFLTPAAANAWRAMKAAAELDGITILIASAFRSIDRQAEIIRGKLSSGQSIEEILSVCAPPGFSEHHTGRAVDVTTPGTPPLETDFETTAAFAWLVQNAGYFGFHMSYPVGNPYGYQYEPWHWCFRGAQSCVAKDDAR